LAGGAPTARSDSLDAVLDTALDPALDSALDSALHAHPCVPQTINIASP